MFGRIAAMLVVPILAACHSWPSGPRGESPHEGLDAVLWMRSAEYRACTEQAYLLARIQLDRALEPENAGWTAAIEQTPDDHGLPPAAILDIDEAVLDTTAFQAEIVATHGRFSPKAWQDWVRDRSAHAIAGAVEFARYAEAAGVRLFYLTNRGYELEGATRQNLEALGFPVDADGGNILSKNERPGWGSDKTSRRRFLAVSHRIVLIVGDDLNDFVSGSRTGPSERAAVAERWRDYWGTRWIILPNPVYGGWERSLYVPDSGTGASRSEVLRRKFDALAVE